MRVGMDASGLLRPDTGIGRYTSELIRGIASVASGVELELLCNTFRGSPAVDVPGRLVNPRIPHRLLTLSWKWFKWPAVETFLGPVDLFHTSDWVHPPQRSGATVTTVHDIGALVHPEWYTPQVVERQREMSRRSAGRADALITVSEFTRREFLRLFEIDRGRIHVVPNGVSSDFRPLPRARARALLERAGVTAPYLLFVGTRERRKNLPGLIEIFARVAEEVPELELQVVGMRPWAEARGVTGVEAWTGKELEERVRELGLADRIRFPGKVPLQLLRAFYSGARAFVYASLYEGFGLPVLEAMACGSAVVAADRSAVPEVVGDAGLLADPEDPDAFASEVLRVLSDDDLTASLRERGVRRAAEFGWDRTARRTLEVYRKVSGAGR